MARLGGVVWRVVRAALACMGGVVVFRPSLYYVNLGFGWTASKGKLEATTAPRSMPVGVKESKNPMTTTLLPSTSLPPSPNLRSYLPLPPLPFPHLPPSRPSSRPYPRLSSPSFFPLDIMVKRNVDFYQVPPIKCSTNSC